MDRVTVWDNLTLYLRLLGVSVRSQLQYRASFIMLALGQFLSTGGEFLAIWALFERFGSLKGWRLAEIALFYGIISIAFAIADAAGRGFDLFANMVRSGEFDRVLLRPRSTALQVAARELQIMRIGRFSQGLVVLVWAAGALGIVWTVPRIMLLLWAVIGGACLFVGLFVLQATMCFWTTESLEIMNTVTYGGVETAQYPITVYRDWFRTFFTFGVPLAALSYFPAVGILGRPDVLGTPFWFQCLAPGIGVLFLVLSLQVWKIGVRHYHSTGS
jgi:ABC-2 type transport system permease protein